MSSRAARPPVDDARGRLKEVSHLAAPIVAGSLSHTAVSLTDSLMVGHLGEDPLAALGASAILILTVFLVFSGLSTAVQVLAARRSGEGRDSEVGPLLHNALRGAVLLGIAAGLVGMFLPAMIMPFFSSSAAVQANAVDYLFYRWGCGMPLLLLLFVFKGLSWGLGLTRMDFFVSVLASVANVFLNWIFIFGNLGAPVMGASGAGLASALANGIALVVYLIFYAQEPRRSRYRTMPLSPFDPTVTRSLLSLAIPRSVQALAFGSSALPFFAMVGTLVGKEALAASTVIWRVFGLTVMIALGIGTASSTLVSRELGAGSPHSAATYVRAALKLGIVVVAVASTLGLAFPGPILSAFNLESTTIIPAIPALRLVLAFQVVDVVGVILARALTGAGEVVYVMVSEILIAWCVCIPLTWLGIKVILPSEPLLGAWLGWAGYMVAWMLAMAVRWRSGHWRRRKI